MANSKAVGGVAIGIVIVVVIAVYAFTQDQINVSNEISMETAQDSSVSISDSATLTKNNSDYTVDEEGNKRYTIIASDSPLLED